MDLEGLDSIEMYALSGLQKPALAHHFHAFPRLMCDVIVKNCSSDSPSGESRRSRRTREMQIWTPTWCELWGEPCNCSSGHLVPHNHISRCSSGQNRESRLLDLCLKLRSNPRISNFIRFDANRIRSNCIVKIRFDTNRIYI
jgi:hypothetical protein